MHKEKFKSVGSCKDKLPAGMSKDSSELHTEARNIFNRDENIFLHL